MEWWEGHSSKDEHYCIPESLGFRVISIRRNTGQDWVIYRGGMVIGRCDSNTPVDEVKIVAETIMKLEGNDGV